MAHTHKGKKPPAAAQRALTLATLEQMERELSELEARIARMKQVIKEIREKSA